MKKNIDKRVIEVDAEVFESMMYYAEVGTKELGHRGTFENFQRHVRKFNPLSAQVEKQKKKEEEDLACARAARKYSRFARILESQRFDIRWENNVARYYQRVNWYMDHGRQQAFPVVISFVPGYLNQYTRQIVHAFFIDSHHLKLACIPFRGKPEPVHSSNVAQNRKDIPENYKVFEVPDKYKEDEGSYIETGEYELIEVEDHPRRPKQIKEAE